MQPKSRDELAAECKRLAGDLVAISEQHAAAIAAAEGDVADARKRLARAEAKLCNAHRARAEAIDPVESRLNNLRRALRDDAPPAIRAMIDMIDDEIAALRRVALGDKARCDRIAHLQEIRREVASLSESPLTSAEIESELARIAAEECNIES